MKHFYFGTEINCISVSGKTVAEVKKQMISNLQTYALELEERGSKREQIKAADIGLKYKDQEEVQELKNKQNSFKWVSEVFNSKVSKGTEEVSFDDKRLKDGLDKLSCFNSSNIIEPHNPSFKYTDKGYVVEDEVLGNKVNKDLLYAQVSNAILKGETTIDLEATNCYVKPQYTSKSKEITDTKNLLNKYVASKVTYSFGASKEILDGAIINKWLKVDDKLLVTLDKDKVKGYVDGLLNTYNTIGKTRSFVTAAGKTIKVTGGDYGWSINADKEAESLITTIKEGQTVSKEPTYLQTAVARDNDIGKTYVEIDMTKQHLWFYKNGSVMAEGDVVTGNMSKGYSTPAGVYRLKYKQRNATLKGQGYSAPVNYWMPFNGGIGIHDASWRSVFGGNIYKTDGSHGCVNAPFSLAQTVFNNIDDGTAVVCYY